MGSPTCKPKHSFSRSDCISDGSPTCKPAAQVAAACPFAAAVATALDLARARECRERAPNAEMVRARSSARRLQIGGDKARKLLLIPRVCPVYGDRHGACIGSSWKGKGKASGEGYT